LKFQLVTGEGAPYVRVTSRDSIRDPFLTFLVEISWAEGRLVREYTLLIDPPTLMAPAAPPETRQPVVQSVAPLDAPEVAQAPEATPLPEPTAPRLRASRAKTSEPAPPEGLRVRRGDTLWVIASGNKTEEAVNINQMMLAIYQRNPQAFSGNINRLKAGAILRMPSADEVRAISRAAALAEIRRQNENWRTGRPTQLAKGPLVSPAIQSEPAPVAEAAPKATPVPSRPRLELVAPDETAPVATPPAAGTAPGGVATDANGSASTGQPENAGTGPTGESAGLVQMDSATALALQTPPSMTAESNSSVESTGSGTLQTLPPQPETSIQTPAAPAPVPAPEATSGGSGGLGSLWLVLVAAGAGLLGWLFWRRRQSAAPQEEEIDFVLNSDGDDKLAATAPHVVSGGRQEPVWAEEKPLPEGGHEPDSDTQPGLTSFKPEAPLGVDQEDPLAEADFNLTYGLYDEALAVVEQALTRQPDRRDLKLKRLEVLFAASDKVRFLKYAKALAAEPQGEADSAWERCMLMGQQMLPDEPLFKNAPHPSMVGDDFLDLDLDQSSDHGRRGAGFDADQGLAFHADGEAATEVLGRRPSQNSTPDAAGVDLTSAVDSTELPFEFSDSDLQTESDPQSENTIEKHLDMARVYLGMEEFTAARRELEQALLEGTTGQQAEARELMGQVDGRAGMAEDETAQALLVDVPGTGTLDIEDFGTRDDNGTRLDLARQYMELDDVDGARTLIEEVVKEGSPDQRREAETLLTQLPPRF
jgi:pilus assembly protein FimV